MVEETAFENGRICNPGGLVTLTLDRVILHTVMHHSSTSTYTPNFIAIETTFCGRTDVCTHVRTDGHLRVALLSRLCRRLCRRVDLIKCSHRWQTLPPVSSPWKHMHHLWFCPSLLC